MPGLQPVRAAHTQDSEYHAVQALQNVIAVYPRWIDVDAAPPC